MTIKKYYEVEYNGSSTIEKEMELLTSMKKGKMFSAITTYIYFSLVLMSIGLLLGIIVLL